jgi:hypothetical protein
MKKKKKIGRPKNILSMCSDDRDRPKWDETSGAERSRDQPGKDRGVQRETVDREKGEAGARGGTHRQRGQVDAMVEAQRRALPPLMGQRAVQAEEPVRDGRREETMNMTELGAAIRSAREARLERELDTKWTAPGPRQDQKTVFVVSTWNNRETHKFGGEVLYFSYQIKLFTFRQKKKFLYLR